MISVVIPVYNGAQVLPTTLPAVRALRDVDEVIYVDDGSSDETVALLAEAADGARLRVVSMPENRGRSAARNAGVQAARGDVLVFFDADVEPPPEAASALGAAARAPGAVASVARLDPVVSEPDDPFQDYVAHHPRGPAPDDDPLSTLAWRFFLSGTCAVDRRAFEAAGGFPNDVPYGEDVVLACRLASRHPTGLRLADTTVRLHDLGDLGRALGHAHQFGAAAALISEPCPSGALDRVRRVGFVGRVASLAAPALRRVVDSLPPGTLRRTAVRYLLASTALRAARRA